jgi:hypothetical protein
MTTLCSDGWRCPRFEGSFDLHATAVFACVVRPPAASHVSVLALATFDTDYVLVRGTRPALAIGVLEASGQTIHPA